MAPVTGPAGRGERQITPAGRASTIGPLALPSQSVTQIWLAITGGLPGEDSDDDRDEGHDEDDDWDEGHDE